MGNPNTPPMSRTCVRCWQTRWIAAFKKPRGYSDTCRSCRGFDLEDVRLRRELAQTERAIVRAQRKVKELQRSIRTNAEKGARWVEDERSRRGASTGAQAA